LAVTSEQIRAARALLRWEQRQLAGASGVSLPTVKRLEGKPGELAAYDATAAKLRTALESAGVVFVDENGHGPGVRLRKAAGQSIPTIEDEADPTSRDQ
jgi:transcriptional regulator with XRE-family HTH domain